MLIKFELENFRSFNSRKVFHTVQRNFKRFTDHIYHHSDGISLLKTTGIYGGNASGKTNLFRGLYFVKKMVEDDDYLSTQEGLRILSYFKLDKESSEKDSSFQVDFISENNVYIYELKINRERKIITFEQLIKLDGDNEVLIFKRISTNKTDSSLEFNEDNKFNNVSDSILTLLGSSSTLLSFGLITDEHFQNAHNWFVNKVKFLFPVYDFTDIAYILSLKKDYLELANRIIKFSKTGIDSLKIESIPIETYLGSEKKDEISYISSVLEEKEFHPFKDSKGNACTAIKSDEDTIKVLKLVTIHLDKDGNKVLFDLEEESRGTLVLLNLLPALILSYGEGVNYFIDEINASLHPILLKEILSQYLLNNIKSAKGQLIFNSHENLLMDEKLIRQDELWLVEKNENGETDIFPLSDIPNIRFDLNLSKNYLNGKFGGVPFEDKPSKLILDVNK